MEYLPRLMDSFLEELLAAHPAVLINGPRACGKTTTAARHSESALRLGRKAEAEAVRADPAASLRGETPPVLIDEWQIVPEVLATIKELVDDGAARGSFLLTGSVRADLDTIGWPMTGRVIRTAMWGLTGRELHAATAGGSFLDRFLLDALSFKMPPDPPDLRGYVELILRSGFPPAALEQNERARGRFLASYIDEVVLRDLALAGASREPVKVRRYLQAVAANTAGTPEHKTLYDAADVARSTAVAYDDLLEQLMITERLPAWSSNRLSRLGHLPKRHLIDPALAQPLLGIDVRAVMRDGDLLGRLVESYLVAQLRVEAAISERSPQLFHLRDANNRREVDLLVEFPNGDVIGIEVKASSAPDRDDARHLRWMRDQLGNRFVGGIVFHTGPRIFRFEPDIHYLPVAALWGS